MRPEQRTALIDQLDRSFLAMPTWLQTACKQEMGTPTHHPETGEKFTSFRQVIEAVSDGTLETLHKAFDDHGDLLP